MLNPARRKRTRSTSDVELAAREKRELAALIRKYAAGLDEADKRDLLTYAARIDAEAGRLERDDSVEKD
jgi:hypothetical protein